MKLNKKMKDKIIIAQVYKNNSQLEVLVELSFFFADREEDAF